MKVSDDTRGERKASILLAMQKLRDKFPLQKIVEGADPLLRAAYVRTLSHWVHHGTTPPRCFSSEAEIQALCALDALTIDDCSIGCFPFSAGDTGIHVHFAEHSVSATCAVDALAISRLVQHASRVTSRCAVCGCHLACVVADNGSVEGGNPEGARVVWRSSASTEGACRHIPCPGIRFICKHCAVPLDATGFSLPEAAFLGNSFFAFQRRLLKPS